jgi:hypothetical protein
MSADVVVAIATAKNDGRARLDRWTSETWQHSHCSPLAACRDLLTTDEERILTVYTHKGGRSSFTMGTE